MKPIRLCEYSVKETSLSADVRQSIEEAAERWRLANGLNNLPLQFGGASGTKLTSKQWVGVVQAGGVRVEIFPKLDRALLDRESPTEPEAASALQGLVRVLEISQHRNLVDVGDAKLDAIPTNYFDLLSVLFARRLSRELTAGRPHAYLGHSDDLPMVRGRIDFGRQVTSLWGRMDRIACRWDEFSPDTPLARLLRCTVEVLIENATGSRAFEELLVCRALLDGVSPVNVQTALSQSRFLGWTRINKRFETCAEVAIGILQGFGRGFEGESKPSFMFLIDMNKLFEDYASELISRRFDDVSVHRQKHIGHLLEAGSERSKGLISQRPDLNWLHQGVSYVADAKYKRVESWLEDEEVGTGWGSNDVRQLICYGQLLKEPPGGHRTEKLLMLSPCLGFEELPEEPWHTAFDGVKIGRAAINMTPGDSYKDLKKQDLKKLVRLPGEGRSGSLIAQKSLQVCAV